MKLTYTTSIDDWTAFTEHAMRRWRQYADPLSIWRWFVAILCGSIAAYLFADVSALVGLAAGLVTVTVMALLFWRWTRWSVLAEARKEMSKRKYLPLFTSERTLEVCDEGLRWESIAGFQLLRWEFVEALEETMAHVFVRLPMRSGFVIPKKSVDDEALKSFLAELRRRIG